MQCLFGHLSGERGEKSTAQDLCNRTGSTGLYVGVACLGCHIFASCLQLCRSTVRPTVQMSCVMENVYFSIQCTFSIFISNRLHHWPVYIFSYTAVFACLHTSVTAQDV